MLYFRKKEESVNRRAFLKTAFAAAIAPGIVKAASNKKRPNIVLFLVDDMGWQDTSLPFWKEKTFLNRRYDTPGMCALAEDGMVFTSAYAQAVCTPTRVSLMTGMNAARHRVTLWTHSCDKSTDSSMPELAPPPDWAMNGLQPFPLKYEKGKNNYTFGGKNWKIQKPFASAMPLPMLLRESGYHTILCGKAHFGTRNTPGADPKTFGFDVNIAGSAVGSPASYYAKENFGGGPNHITGLEQYHGQKIFLTEVLTREALAALEKVKEKPFFLYFAHYAVHTPVQMDPRFEAQFEGIPAEQHGSKIEQRYATLVKGMDKSLEDLVAWLKAKNLYEDTIILFMSDNGGLAVKRSGRITNANFPLRYGKGSAYEGGIREPMIVRCPKRWMPGFKAGTRCDTPVACEDFFPSILEMAGVSKAVPQVLDGKSFVPLLQGKQPPAPRALYWHCPNIWGEGRGVTPAYDPYSAIRRGDWKLIYRHDNQTFSLFNLEADIGESQNRIDSEPKILGDLAWELSNYLRSVNAQMPTIKATGKPVPWPDEVVDQNGKRR